MEAHQALKLVLAFVLVSFAADAKTPPLFVYEEDGDTLSFTSPKTVRLVRKTDGGTKVCETDLPDNGNMWSGRDVESAFRNSEVQAALRAHGSISSSSTGTVSAGTDTLEWKMICRWCTPETPGIENFHKVIRGVMMNRRLLCTP